MIVELGHFALVLALVVAAVQTVVPAWGVWRGDSRIMGVAHTAALLQAALVATAFLALTHAYVTSDFSVANVWMNSHSRKPMLYKLSGVWGNHEGSMLLWVLILAAFGATVALAGRQLPERLKTLVLAAQGSVGLGFLLFLVVASNPFLRLSPAPIEGRGLNPILQDPALAFHPPFLYAGYVGFSMAFSFSVAALIDGRIDGPWARWVRPWTLVAWMFLTLGIAMGSWWAYYELGWGGWWFWDPVENASLMPWLAGTALLHSAIVMEKREALKIWTILLAILTFSLSLLGTFLVRSGVLTSVHAFAVDPARGVFILGLLSVYIGGALALFAWRAGTLRQGGMFAPISREAGLVLNNVLLATATGTVLVGTLYPLVLEGITGAKISVGPPYFNQTFGPLMVPLLLTLPLGPLLAWKRGDLAAAMSRLLVAVGVTAIAIVAAYALVRRGPWLAPIGLGLGVWVIAGALSEIAFRTKLGTASFAETARRLVNLPRSAIGTALAHIGLGLSVIGIVATSAWQTELITVMKPGQKVDVAGFELTFRGSSPGSGPNYTEVNGSMVVTSGGRPVTELMPSKRLYDQPRQATTEAGIYNAWSGDLYVVLGDEQAEGAYAVRIYFNPFVRLIWIGALVMFLAGGLSLSDRRLRIGAPRRSSAGVAPAE
ncbi:MAG: heme lyase CcmF/NrfE family subunit [Hyphomicrobiaceae bacterium]